MVRGEGEPPLAGLRLINRRRAHVRGTGAEPGNQDDLVFTVGPSRDVTDWFYMFRLCERIPVLRSHESTRRDRETAIHRRGESKREKERR